MAQTLFMTYETWFYTILNFNNEAILTGASPWTAATIPIMAGLISAMVQLFYAWRIWILSKQMFMRGMAVIIVLIALGQSLSAIVASSIFSIQPTQANLLKLHPAFDFWLAGSFTTDILISGSMIFILWKARSRTTWARSERLIDNLIINVIQTGTLTVICAGVDLAFFVGLEATNLHLAP
ncbi:hypothetical protein BDN70DRAFT_798390 [Pholiota conissans]|uniref:DUF6534 domain-containing protein n=1 Tax=Pholiota conissans TaxID=109636 RepID=A0A9P5ZBB7_9AGAR|nr:hypothetical protein BDN70DRAFT_798390 [Pholiota conissans]